MINDIKNMWGKNNKTNNNKTKTNHQITPLKLKAKMFLTKTTPENASFDGIL